MVKKSKNKRVKAKKGAWFVPVRGSYLPASSEGWWTYLPFLGYLIFTLYFGIQDTDTVSLAILFIVPNWVCAGVVMTYLAKSKS